MKNEKIDKMEMAKATNVAAAALGVAHLYADKHGAKSLSKVFAVGAAVCVVVTVIATVMDVRDFFKGS